MSTAAWADGTLPTPVYTQNFESANTTKGTGDTDHFGITGATLTGNGSIGTGDPVFGKYYQAGGTGTTRTNYLTISTTAFSEIKTAGNEEATISFWLNTYGNEDTNEWGSIFVAYGESGNANHAYPFSFDIRANLSTHSSLWETYFDDPLNVNNSWRTKGASLAESWHHVAIVYNIDKTNSPYKTVMKYYIDGTCVLTRNITSYSAPETTTDKTMFEDVNRLSEFVIGGNSPVWSDPDNGYAYDEINIYSEALSEAQIALIAKTNVTVEYKLGDDVLKSEIVGNNVLKGSSFSYGVHQYILSNGRLYSTTQGSSNYYYRTNNASATLVENLTDANINNVVFFVEGEDISGITVASADNNRARASNAKMGYTDGISNFKNVVTLPAGTYQVHLRYVNGNTTARALKVKVGDTEKMNLSISQADYSTKTSESFTIDKLTTISLACEGASTGGLDWIYITGTPANEIIGAIDYSTPYYNKWNTLPIWINPGEKAYYKFVNYNNGGNTYENWYLFGATEASENVVIFGPNHSNTAANATYTSKPTFTMADLNGATVELTAEYNKVAENNYTITVTGVTTKADGSTTLSPNLVYTQTGLTAPKLKLFVSVELSWLELVEQSVKKDISDAGYATYYSNNALDFANATPALTASIITGHEGNSLTLQDVENVPAETGVLLAGSEGTCTIPVIATSSTDVTANKLKGVHANTEKTASTIYILMKGAKGVGFYKNNNAFTVGANTAYLDATDVDGAGARSFYDLGGTTAIENIKVGSKDNVYYNLQGQRILYPTKGLYIVNGKKVIIK